jgi:hypothetical protein
LIISNLQIVRPRELETRRANNYIFIDRTGLKK